MIATKQRGSAATTFLISMFLTFVTALVVLQACAGAKAREELLLPRTAIAWEGVRLDVLRGIEDARADGDIATELIDQVQLDVVGFLDVQFAKRDIEGLALFSKADLLQQFALRGIQDRVDDGEAGEGVAESLRERVKNFLLSLEKLKQ